MAINRDNTGTTGAGNSGRTSNIDSTGTPGTGVGTSSSPGVTPSLDSGGDGSSDAGGPQAGSINTGTRLDAGSSRGAGSGVEGARDESGWSSGAGGLGSTGHSGSRMGTGAPDPTQTMNDMLDGMGMRMNGNGGAMETMKVISPGQHAVLDYAVAGTFLTMGLRYRSTNRSAATLAFLNAGMVAAMSLMTDYPGGVTRTLSFKTHRTGDIVQAALAGLGPLLFGFGHAPEATFFYSQAASEVAVIAATDWDAA